MNKNYKDMILERKHLGEILNVFFLITLDREEALVLHIWNRHNGLYHPFLKARIKISWL